jgi:hypothetical protein
MPIPGDGRVGNPCSKWSGCQPVLVDIPIDAKFVDPILQKISITRNKQ